MKSNIQMESQHSFIRQYRREEMLNLGQIRINQPLTATDDTTAFDDNINQDNITLSDQVQELLAENDENQVTNGNGEVAENKEVIFELSAKDKKNINLLQAFVKKLTGRDIEINVIEKVKLNKNNTEVELRQVPPPVEFSSFEYTFKQSYYGEETMSFHSSGSVMGR